MTGTELKIIRRQRRGARARGRSAATLHTNARTDDELLTVWLKSHADGSAHTRRAYQRIGARFVAALHAAGADLRRATVEDVQTALEAMRSKADGAP